MISSDNTTSTDNPNQLCPDLRANWQLDDQTNTSGQVILQAKIGNRRYQFEPLEGYALKYFNGQYTTRQVLNRCRSHFGTFIPSDLVTKLLEKLLNLGILTALPEPTHPHPTPPPKTSGVHLKTTLQWIPNPDGYWILHNPEDQTFFEFHDIDKQVISQLGQKPLTELANLAEVSLEQLQELLKSLGEAGMLEGTKAQKPPNQFNLLKLLSFQIPLFNPDPFLSQQIDKIAWIWTWQFGFFLTTFITASISVWLAVASDAIASQPEIWKTGGNTTLITFCLLIMLVVFLHEIGHACTLKHYGGTVPEIGLLFICAGTLTQPYPITLNSDTTPPSNNNQISDYATLLKNCGETGTQNNLDNTLASVLPNSNPQIPSDSHQEVPEPTTIAGLALAAGIGSWWKKKGVQKK